MVKALVTGGYFDDSGECVVWHVDLEAGRADEFLRWTPPDDLRVPSKGFAGGSLAADGILYVAAHAAVVRIDTARAVVTGVLHQPCMNDLHHVAVADDRLLVSNTGLGAVDVFDLSGGFLGSHALLPAWANHRRFSGEVLPEAIRLRAGWEGATPPAWPDSPPVDPYFTTGDAPFHRQKIRDHLHVNHVAIVGDRVIATCFADGTLRDLARFETVRHFPEAFLHDGFEYDGSFWLTAIDGRIFELAAHTYGRRRVLQTFETGHFGWCRGLAVGERGILLGLTEVRPNRLPRHRWADCDPEGSETSLLMLDRSDGALLERIDLTERERHSKVYSVLPWEAEP